jgi:hypothetical protein
MKSYLYIFGVIFSIAFAKAQTVDAELLQQLKHDDGVGTSNVTGTPLEGTIMYDDNLDSIYYRNTTQWVRLLSTNDLGSNNSSTPTLNVTKQTIGYSFAAAQTAANGTNNYNTNCTVTKIAGTTGRYSVAFTSPHPNGASYPITLGIQEDLTNRDGRIAQVVTGTQTANGFDVYIGTGDNGGTADVYVEEVWYFNVTAEIEVVTDVSLSGSTSPPSGVTSLTSSGTPTGDFTNIQLNDNNAFYWALQFNAPNAPGTYNYEILLDNVPYDIGTLNLGNHTVVEQDNLDGTFDYLFTSTSPINGNNAYREISASSVNFVTSTGTGTACGCITFYLLP